jgi:hypothetical protein
MSCHSNVKNNKMGMMERKDRKTNHGFNEENTVSIAVPSNVVKTYSKMIMPITGKKCFQFIATAFCNKSFVF